MPFLVYNYELVKGRWNWVDQTPYDYKNWFEGEPDHNDNLLHCAKVWEATQDLAGKWKDTFCSDLNGYVCKGEKCTSIIIFFF